ncbi:8871_t:CDS:2 [Funneliformis geosporum]|nr:8871_t:CDS:2 [Funneliformis geosporum]
MINDKNEALIKKEIEEELDEFNSNSFATLNSIHPTNDIKAKDPWQIAFIVYGSLDSIQKFYDNTWSILLMEFSVRIELTDITEIQTSLRQQFELKLTGFPFNTT